MQPSIDLTLNHDIYSICAFSSSAEPISWCERPLPDLPCSLVGRDKECEEIVGNYVLNQFRIGVIYGSLGIGKTSVAVEVGHKLLSMGWAVSYHVCNDVESTLEIVTPFTNLNHVFNSATHLKNDNINDTFPVDRLHPTLLILDQVENVIEDNEPVIIPKALQTLVDIAKQVRSVRLLFVSRKQMSLTDDLAFPLELESLSKASAIQLLESFSQISSQHELELIAKGCGCNPVALMIIRALIHKGIPETEIISKMSSPEHFWKSIFGSVEKCYDSTEGETKWAIRNFSKLRELSAVVVGIQETVQMQMFLEWLSEETNYLSEVEGDCNEKPFDPCYCQCRPCLSSNRMESSKMALSSSVYTAGTYLLCNRTHHMPLLLEGYRCCSDMTKNQKRVDTSLAIQTVLFFLGIGADSIHQFCQR